MLVQENKASGNLSDQDYHAYVSQINQRFQARFGDGKTPLFKTNVDNLFDTFLDALPPENRQYHTCSCCRNFVNRFGGLVTISDKGVIDPAIWVLEDTPDYYKYAVSAMNVKIRTSKVVAPFLSSETEWGSPVTGIWRHLSLVQPPAMKYRRSVLTAGQKMAEKREDFKTVMYALNEFTQPMVEQAVKLLKTDSLYRSEKVLGAAEWLYNLHVARAGAHHPANVVWKAVATAPAGFCHPRSSMIGTLLEDIAAGLDYSDIAARFKSKMHPLMYQRPQAAPSAGTIAQAEKIVEQLGVARSLERRFAQLYELQTIWTPAPAKAPVQTGGVFGHLKPKDSTQIDDMKIPPITMTWDKFLRTVLPTAEQIKFFVPMGRANYTAYTTAVHADAPPILQWDTEEQRNPVSTYLWHGGTMPSQWGLSAGYVNVTGVSYRPNMWFEGNYPNQSQGVAFILEGAHESRNGGLALFPEILKAEFHQIRSVIEAYSNRGEIQDMATGTACGILLDKGSNWNHIFRVTTAGQTVDYKLDRWD